SPDGRHLALSTSEGRKSEIWALENFLPPLDEPKPTATAAAATPVAATVPNVDPARPLGVINRQVLDNAPPEGDFSPDGRLLAYTDEESGQLAVRDLATGQHRLLTNEETQTEPARVPSVTPIWPPQGYKAWGPSFSSDGSLIAYWWRSKQPNMREL